LHSVHQRHQLLVMPKDALVAKSFLVG
jgi:hypothetical protein